jgi:hypothetical protein
MYHASFKTRQEPKKQKKNYKKTGDEKIISSGFKPQTFTAQRLASLSKAANLSTDRPLKKKKMWLVNRVYPSLHAERLLHTTY